MDDRESTKINSKVVKRCLELQGIRNCGEPRENVSRSKCCVSCHFFRLEWSFTDSIKDGEFFLYASVYEGQ